MQKLLCLLLALQDVKQLEKYPTQSTDVALLQQQLGWAVKAVRADAFRYAVRFSPAIPFADMKRAFGYE